MELLSMSAEFLTDPQQQPKVLEFFNALRDSPNGWKSCVQHIVGGFPNNAQNHVWFLCFQVIEQYLTKRYPNADTSEQAIIREFLRHILIRMDANANESIAAPAYIKNKLAQLFSSVFVVDFPTRWRSFMQDVFLNNLRGDAIIDLYCRFLLAVDGDVADREVQRTKQDADRNTIIKDTMREVCVREMVESWLVILAKSITSSDDKTASLCLNVIGAYVAWIDIELIANDRFVPLITQSLVNVDTQEAAVDCVCSILSKGMDPMQKLKLVEAFDAVLKTCGFMQLDKERDEEELSHVAVVVNCIGMTLVDCFPKLIKSGQADGARYASDALESKVPDLLRLISHESPEVASCVVEFAHHFVIFLKQTTPLSDRQREILKQLLLATLQRYRFPDDYNYEQEGEDEAEFQDMRKELKIIFNNIAQLDSYLAVSTIEQLVRNQLTNWRNLSTSDVELSISLLYFLGDTSSLMNMLTAGDSKTISLKSLVELLILSGVSKHIHPAVSLQYLETISRFDKLIASEPALLTDMVASFLDERGLHNRSAKVRSRAAYLFTRFVKANRVVLQQYVEQILYHLQDLLAVAPQTDGEERLLSSDDQLFLFETTGTLIVCGTFTAEQKRTYMRQLLGSLVTRFAEGFQLLNATTDERQKRILYDYLNCIMAYASRTTKAFSNQVTMKSCLSDDVFIEIMQAFLSAVRPHHAPLLFGLRQYLHRMVLCLDNELLPHIPSIVSKLLAISQDLKSLQDFLTLIQQAVVKYQEHLLPYLEPNVIQIWETIWTALSTPIDSNDEVSTRDYQYLRRAYFQLLSTAASKKVLDLFCLGGDAIRERILSTICEGAMTTADPTVQQQCFSFIHKCTEAVKLQPRHTTWFNVFLISQALRLCFVVPLDRNFDFGDGQSSVVLYEIAACLKRFYDLQGDQLSSQISGLWQTLGLPNDVCDSFCFTVKSSETKPLQKYLRSFFQGILQRR